MQTIDVLVFAVADVGYQVYRERPVTYIFFVCVINARDVERSYSDPNRTFSSFTSA